MSRQRSSSSTSGRSSSSSASRATSAAPPAASSTVQEELTGGGLGGGQQFEGQTTGQKTGQTGGMVEQAKEKTQQLAGQVQQKATQRVESGLARGKVQAAETLNVVAQTLISTGQQLRERNQEPVSRYVDQVADRVQRVSNYLQNTDVSEMVDRTEQFARRRPALFLGGAFALGLLGARFLKSSRRQQQTGSTGFSGGGTGTQGFTRERSTTFDQEVTTPVSRQEWAAGGAGLTGLADVAADDLQTGQQRQTGVGRQPGGLDYGLATGGPEASQR